MFSIFFSFPFSIPLCYNSNWIVSFERNGRWKGGKEGAGRVEFCFLLLGIGAFCVLCIFLLFLFFFFLPSPFPPFSSFFLPFPLFLELSLSSYSIFCYEFGIYL